MIDSLTDAVESLLLRKISSVELTQHYLKKINNNQQLNAFISLDGEHALACALDADKRRLKGNVPVLTGIPMAHKDNFCTQRLPTTCGSLMLKQFVSPYDATVVKRLAQAGSFMLGKTNMDEFAMGSSNEHSYFGAVKNPWDNTCTPGGSSGGSAASVAAGLIAYATGSDTGGSIRQPAAFCGVSGLKPTYGLVSRYGLVAYASSLDQAGPIARTAQDLALLLSVMAGFDPLDSTSVDRVVPDYQLTLAKSIKGIRIGIPDCFFNTDVDACVQQAIHDALACFKAQGAVIIPINLSMTHLWAPCYYVIACAEASSNLSRYDGVRFGHRSTQASTIDQLISYSRSEGFGPEVKRRILTGMYVLSAGYIEDYYLQALKIRRLIQQELLAQLNQVDVILGPVTASTAFKLGQKNLNPTQDYLADLFTVAANLSGLPAIAIPAGFARQLPIGMQLMGRAFSEQLLLNIAFCYQQATDWHKARPGDIQ